MQTSIIQIGNSRGVILPAEMLHRMRLRQKSLVNVTMDGDAIVIRRPPREGWAAAAQKAHDEGGDSPLIPDLFEDENLEDWQW